ncbi:recombinase family protein [Bengtsoniella intestinalis]|uniref:recombinase family protein n=1 Tax=Bengtsoniella intestinalis TaxID=3073143 RepID=UPI00391F053D
MNAVIYARYSSDNQREESIEGQLRECMAFAESKGLTIIDTYIDRALSAKTDNRPEFQRMIKESIKRKFEVIVVWKLDRFSRNRYDSAHYKAQLKKNNVRVVSATESISDDASGILLESMLEGFAEYYSADLSEKVIRGLTENALKCKYNGGGMTLGYQIDSDQYFQIDPVVAPIIQDVYQRYVDGATIKNLVDYLKGLGIKNYRGGDLSIDAVKLLLKNRKYIGEYSYRDIVTPNGIPAIVSEELFNKAQARMAKNKKAPARQKAKQDMYILTTKLFCGKCGAYMVGESGTSRNGTFHQYYKCANVKNHKGCDKKTVRKAWIEELVIKYAMEKLMDDDYIDQITEMAFEAQSKENTVIPQIKKQLSDTKRAINNMINAIEQGIITSSTRERLQELEQTKENLEINLAREEIKKPALERDQIKFWLLKFRTLDMSKEDDRQIIIDNFVNSIYLYDDRIIFIFNYKTESQIVNLEDINCSDMSESTAPRKKRLPRQSLFAWCICLVQDWKVTLFHEMFPFATCCDFGQGKLILFEGCAPSYSPRCCRLVSFCIFFGHYIQKIRSRFIYFGFFTYHFFTFHYVVLDFLEVISNSEE